MASLHRITYLRQDGTSTTTFQIRWRAPGGEHHKKNFKKEPAARKWKRQVEHQADTGLYIDPAGQKTRLGDYVTDVWLPTKTDLKPKTRAGYETVLRLAILPQFGKVALARIQSTEVEQWLIDMRSAGKSASWIRQSRTLLHQILAHAHRHGLIARNPVAGVIAPVKTTKKQARFITAVEIDRIADTVDDRYHALVLALGYLGLRWGEVVGLQRQDGNLLKRRLHIRRTLSEVDGHFHETAPKNWRERDVTIPTFLADALARHLQLYTPPEPDALVFTTEQGKPIRNSNFRRRAWLPALAEARVEPLTMHEMRHSAASIMAAEGWSLVEVQRQLGHSSISVTADIYSHLWDGSWDELADRLDRLHRTNSSI